MTLVFSDGIPVQLNTTRTSSSVTVEKRELDGSAYTLPSSAGALHLNISTTVDADDNDRPYRLMISVKDATNVDENIFVYMGVPTTPGQAVGSDYMFVTVATVEHMEELPIDLPDPTYNYMYRKSFVDLIFPCAKAMEKAQNDILRRIEELLGNLQSMATMRDGLSVAYGFTTE